MKFQNRSIRKKREQSRAKSYPNLNIGQFAGGGPDAPGYLDQRVPSYQEILQQHPGYFEQALTPKEAAAFIDSTTPALAQMRTRGSGPPYVRMPTTTPLDIRRRPRGPIRYVIRDLIGWLREQRRYSNTAQEVMR